MSGMAIALSDQEIIGAVLRGETQHFAQLVDRYQSYVFTLALRITQSREDAEEIAQDTFIKAFRSLADFKGNAKFSTWLYTIAHNTGITYLRKKKMQVQSIDEERGMHAADQHASDFRSDRVEEQSRQQMVRKAIAMLSPDDAQLIMLFYQGEQTLQEIGLVLGMEPNTVKVRLFRARQRLKEKMETYFREEVSNLHTY
jgi:RNA polymerase sigma-70 factor (ECF subfamily)